MSARRPITPEDLWSLPRVGEPSPLPDGASALVGVTKFDLATNEGRERLFRVALGEREAVALTSEEASSSQPAPSPDGKLVAFVRKPSGSDVAQLWVMPLDGGEARRITDVPLGARDPRFFPDGRRIGFLSNVYRDAKTLEAAKKRRDELAKSPVKAHVSEDRIVRFWDAWRTDGEVPHLFVVDTDGGEPRDLLPESERLWDLMDDTGQWDVAPDGSEIAFSANSTFAPYATTRWAIFTVSTNGGPVRCVTPDGTGDEVRPRYSRDGRLLVWGRRREWDDYADRVRIARLDRRTGAIAVLTEGWDRSASEWELLDDRTLVVAVEERGRTALYRMAIDADVARPERLAIGGTLHGLRIAGGRVWAQHHTTQSPPEVATIAANGAIERASRFTEAKMAELELGQVEETEIRGAGGDPVQVLVAYPPGFDRTRKWPLVHLIHGGPYGTFGDGWHFRWNVHAFGAPGYVCAMVNFHGSSSFGEAFSRSIRADWGGKPAQDVLLATERLVETGCIDEGRMAIAGGSYGGYLTTWLATQTTRFRCAIAHAAVTNLTGMWSSDATHGLEKELGGEPWGPAERRAVALRNDPATHAAGYATPMLVVHGAKDYRVPVEQGLELYGMLKAKGVPARLVHYPDENHWILKPQNSLHWYGEVLGWLERWLGKGPTPG